MLFGKGTTKKTLSFLWLCLNTGYTGYTPIKYGHLGGTTLSSHWIGCFSNSGYEQELTLKVTSGVEMHYTYMYIWVWINTYSYLLIPFLGG